MLFGVHIRALFFRNSQAACFGRQVELLSVYFTYDSSGRTIFAGTGGSSDVASRPQQAVCLERLVPRPVCLAELQTPRPSARAKKRWKRN